MGLLLTQFRGQSEPFIQKSAAPGTRIEGVRVAGEPGFWLAGRPHAHVYLDARGKVREGTLRLAGDTLLWQRGPVTLRLEGARSKEAALAIARGVR